MNKGIQEQLDIIAGIIKHKLQDGEIVCPTCKGVMVVQKSDKDGLYMTQCSDCVDGKAYVCKHCGKIHKKHVVCGCDGDKKEREEHYRQQSEKRKADDRENRKNLLDKARKISLDDLIKSESDGLFIEDKFYDKDDFDGIRSALRHEFTNKNNKIDYVFVANREKLSVNIYDYVSDLADDFIEDGSDKIYKDENYHNGVKMLQKWVEDCKVYGYSENFNLAVDVRLIRQCSCPETKK